MTIRQFYRPHEIRARLEKAGLSVSIRTIYYWISSGKLRSVAGPGGLRVPAAAVEEVLRESQEET